ncbi:unnamed protein product [Moneuplotes crassus]|uniref:C2H2-type domain-containing protein n=1 Tax=Euplotes crassus TaxID=5936 RepID=A0AAD1XH25_EUPCR|nr:unnamed protein product [Moneuplotes crassus]
MSASRSSNALSNKNDLGSIKIAHKNYPPFNIERGKSLPSLNDVASQLSSSHQPGSNRINGDLALIKSKHCVKSTSAESSDVLGEGSLGFTGNQAAGSLQVENIANPRQKFCTCGLDKKQQRLVNRVLTVNNLDYLYKLREYDYRIKEKNSPITGRPMYVYVCQYKGVCKKEFERSWNLLDHCRVHMGIKPYTCPICNKKFTQKGNLNKHLTTH